MLEALDQSAYADNTIVIFWSDNGYHMGEKNHFEKATLWEIAAYTPIMIRMPDRAHAGVVTDTPINSIDFFPTLIDYCGLEQPAHTPEGLNLRPLLEDPFADWERPAITNLRRGDLFSPQCPVSIYPIPRMVRRNSTITTMIRTSGTTWLKIQITNPSKTGLKQWKPERFEPTNGGRNG